MKIESPTYDHRHTTLRAFTSLISTCIIEKCVKFTQFCLKIINISLCIIVQIYKFVIVIVSIYTETIYFVFSCLFIFRVS